MLIPSCKQILDQNFNVLAVFNLPLYKFNMPALHKELLAIRKDRFATNDRIIFTMFDHDYHLDYQGAGWTFRNLQSILAHLDISNFFCILLTHHHNWEEYAIELQKKITHDDYPIETCTTWLVDEWFPDDQPMIYNETTIDFQSKFCALSRLSRPHRTYFIAKLFYENLTNYGMVGLNNLHMSKDLLSSDNNKKNIASDLMLLDIPQSYQKVMLQKPSNRELLEKFCQSFSTFKNFQETDELENKPRSHNQINIDPISKSFLYVGLETDMQLPKVHISRISIRGIVQRRPFVIVSSPNALATLQQHGFKTFDSYWDESYDQTVDLEDRVDKIINIIKFITSLSIAELTDLYKKMENIIEHNHSHYHNHFKEIEQKKLTQWCINNANR
jgi:hypothetical protein